MSDYVKLTPKGLFVYNWCSETRKNIRSRPKKMSILSHLRSNCEITEGTTLKNIFEVVERYKLLKVFIGQYSWCNQIDAFHTQAQEPMRQNENDPLDYLEIYWQPEVHQFIERIKHPSGLREKIKTVDFEASAGFHGIGPTPENEKYQSSRPDGKTQFSVSYSPMWELIDLPVKLDKDFSVYEPFDKNKHKDGLSPEKLLTATREYSLLDILDAIYWDISFMGGPQENKEFIEEMKSRVEDIKNGTVELIPFEEVMKRLGEDE